MRLRLATVVFLFGLSGPVLADGPTDAEFLLPGGTLYSISKRTYQSLRLPEGWTVAEGAFSPDSNLLALVLVGSGIPLKLKPAPPNTLGPVNKTVRLWHDSARLVVIDRHSGSITKSSLLKTELSKGEWTISWSSGTARATAVPPGSVSGFSSTDSCPRTLAVTKYAGKEIRFAVESASCSTPPESSDFYRLLRPNEVSHRDAILWEKRVAVHQGACPEPYACYSGADVQFFTANERLFLVWDGDLYAYDPSTEEPSVQLVTQLLPQYSHPLAIASGETHFSALDVLNKVSFQPVSGSLSIPHQENPLLYVQNFCPTRSFNAVVEIGPYTKNLMVPAGYQVGAVDVGSFKDRPYMPLLISVTWTSFHHITDPIICQQPYTLSPNTSGIIAALQEDERGMPVCRISSQESH